MTKHVKIVLSGSRDIPLNQLVLSQANVRRVKAGVSIDALAADIARRGLLQSLTVRAQRDAEGAETGLFEVPAGGRRFRALEKLVKQRRMVKTQPVPCIVRYDDQISAEEDSLAENVHREALHPLDQFRAMQQLVTQGTDVETVAATFMTTSTVVKQRLRLASVSPKLHEVYAEDGMTLEQLMAFSVSEDHERQEQVWEMLQSSYNQQPYMIRAKLTEQSVRVTDKRVRFVGLDTYVAAGGYILRDLFEDDQGGWLQDVTLLDRLVNEKLKAEGARIGEEGWKWIAVAVDFPYDYDDDMRVIDGDQPEMTEADEARLAALREEAEALEEEWSGAGDVPDEVDARVTAIDEEISTIVSRPLVYQPTEMARAGVFVSIDSDGSLYVERGYVRPEDEPAQEPAENGDADEGAGIGEGAYRAANTGAAPAIVSAGGASGAAEGADEEEQDDLLRPLPDRLVTELTTHRTLALRNAVASHPQIAFAAVLHAIVLDTFYHYSSSASCVEISVRGGSLGTHAPGLNDSAVAHAIDARHESWSERLPDQPAELWDVLVAFSSDDQAALFAHCASFGINAVWEPANRYNEGRVSARTVSGRIEHSHVLARAADLDMVAAGWTATVDNYLGRVTKVRILAAVEEAKGAEVAARMTGMKKPDMAKEAERLLDHSGWLADLARGWPTVVPLKIVVTDVDQGLLEVLDAHETPDVVIAEAVAALISIPIVFKPAAIPSFRPGRFADGGLVSNLPIWGFSEEKLGYEREHYAQPPVPVVGFTLANPTANEPNPGERISIFKFLGRVIGAALQGSQGTSTRFLDDVTIVPLETELKTLDFDAGWKSYAKAREAGRGCADRHLRFAL